MIAHFVETASVAPRAVKLELRDRIHAVILGYETGLVTIDTR